MTNAIITGAAGGLGLALQRAGEAQSDLEYNIIPTDKSTLDVTNPEMVEAVFKHYKPSIVFHCAAINTDYAENNKDLAYSVNVLGTKLIATACAKYGATCVFFSSDYVFDGQLDRPYNENDLLYPVNYYGVTKLLAEELVQTIVPHHYIVRISWLFGPYGNTFLQKMVTKSKDPFVKVVDDQVGSPSYTLHLASAILNLVRTNQYGVYHITNDGFCSWADYAEEIFKRIGSNTRVIRVSSNEFETVARRPKNSRLDKTKFKNACSYALPNWRDALDEYLDIISID